MNPNDWRRPTHASMGKPRARWVAQHLNPRSASLRYRCIYPMTELRRGGNDVALWDAEEPLDTGLVLVFDAWTLFPSVSEPAAAQSVVALAQSARQAGARIVLDNCDNPFAAQAHLPGWDDGLARLGAMLNLADVVVCCSQALVEELHRQVPCQARWMVIDDPVEQDLSFPGDRWYKRLLSPSRARARWALVRHARAIARDRRTGRVPLVWFGNHGNRFSPGGMLDLLDKRSVFESVAQQHPLSLTVISNHPHKFADNFSDWSIPTHYLEWDRDTFHQAVQLHDVSVIPSIDNAFTRCKSSNRLVLSAYLGLAVQADPIPAYQPYGDFALLGDWAQQLPGLLTDPAAARERNVRQRAALLSRNGIDVIAARWHSALFSTA